MGAIDDTAWRVNVDEYTRAIDATFTGDPVAPRLMDMKLEAIPQDFGIGVVFGPSGSGKSWRLRQIAKHLGLPPCFPKLEFLPNQAVASHPGLGGDAIDRLSCVGLNRIPSWGRPFHCLSNGEQSRVRAALTLASGAVLENFAAVVDEATAKSMGTSVARLVEKKGYRRVLITTTKSCVLPHLKPDFVVFARSGLLHMNPYPASERRCSVKFDWRVDGFLTKSEAEAAGSLQGWQGEEDRCPRSIDVLATGQELLDAARVKKLTCSVDADSVCTEALNAFDYDFDGKSDTNVWVLKAEKLPPGYGLGLIVGPSGTGKSSCLAALQPDGHSAAAAAAGAWATDRAVISQLTHGPPEEAQALCDAVALPVEVALQPFHVLSEGEQHRAELARGLAAAMEPTTESQAPEAAICLDEYTSNLDRTLAHKVCVGISAYIREARAAGRRTRSIIVAAVHEDVQEWLDADWVLQTKTGRVVVQPEGGWPHSDAEQLLGPSRVLKPSLSQSDGHDYSSVKKLLHPPVLQLEVKRLAPHHPGRAMFHSTFEEHHYMRGKLPSSFLAVMVREQETGMPVAFNAISNFPGRGNGGITFLESRLVTLPQWQGFGIGPKLSEGIGEILLSSGKRLFSVTHHPRLGQQREASDVWRATSANGKAAKSLNNTKSERKAFRHQFMGKDGHGNDQLAREASANSVGLLARRGVFVLQAVGNPSAKTSAFMREMEGRTPREVLAATGKADQVRVRKDIERCLAQGYLVLEEQSSCEPPVKRLRLCRKTRSSDTPYGLAPGATEASLVPPSGPSTPERRPRRSNKESTTKMPRTDTAAV